VGQPHLMCDGSVPSRRAGQGTRPRAGDLVRFASVRPRRHSHANCGEGLTAQGEEPEAGAQGTVIHVLALGGLKRAPCLGTFLGTVKGHRLVHNPVERQCQSLRD
jgi:hypothetical protein